MTRRGRHRAGGGDAIVVLVTAASGRQAVRMGRALVEAKLAACANVVRGVRSIYRWGGKVCDDREVLLVVKSRASLFAGLAREVKRLHSYQVPEVIALPVVHGAVDYLAWVRKSTRKSLK